MDRVCLHGDSEGLTLSDAPAAQDDGVTSRYSKLNRSSALFRQSVSGGDLGARFAVRGCPRRDGTQEAPDLRTLTAEAGGMFGGSAASRSLALWGRGWIPGPWSRSPASAGGGSRGRGTPGLLVDALQICSTGDPIPLQHQPVLSHLSTVPRAYVLLHMRVCRGFYTCPLVLVSSGISSTCM